MRIIPAERVVVLPPCALHYGQCRSASSGARAAAVAISSVTGAKMERQGLTNLSAIAQQIPTLKIEVNSGLAFGGQISLRGIQSAQSTASIEQAVSINVDGVPISYAGIVRLGQFDLQQMDVLKGPQALFFGKNASGGIIVLKSAEPTPELDVMVRTGYEFEADEANNLYKLWNRMSAGSYFPRPVRAVEVPKDHGAGVRVLGVPTVADRVAQTAAARLLEERLEPIFHPDSDGYRPGRDGHDALAKARKRCWKQDWVLDLDIRKFFDSVPHGLLTDMVRRHTDLRWVLLYIERWLVAPMQMPDGTLVERDKGTPQGSPISPLLANLFLHYALDAWMANRHPSCPFERYADDIVVHCDTEQKARNLLAAIANRLGAFGLELHPDKTKIVYCKDTKRRGDFEHTSFDFLGYTFRGRRVKGRRGFFVGFNPAMSTKATKAVSQKIRAWHLNRRSDTDLSSLAREINAQVRGWIGYCGAFYRSKLHLMATDKPATEPLAIYLNTTNDPLAHERETAIGKYLQGEGLASADVQIKPGANPHAGYPSSSGLIRYSKTESGSPEGTVDSTGTNTGSAAKPSSPSK